ncbi:hypothetical protein BpHYR1_048349 [Brachionus plicatilis]|uniref:Uncharacterized protein n=1 Tax=Brachionus plicatilis TaxID=10195 RepID=A0A3M7QQC8_BRAPC|nr:hypothetical protein BpHYR1_048349 [Brachionus plicatilis]
MTVGWLLPTLQKNLAHIQIKKNKAYKNGIDFKSFKNKQKIERENFKSYEKKVNKTARQYPKEKCYDYN